MWLLSSSRCELFFCVEVATALLSPWPFQPVARDNHWFMAHVGSLPSFWPGYPRLAGGRRFGCQGIMLAGLLAVCSPVAGIAGWGVEEVGLLPTSTAFVGLLAMDASALPQLGASFLLPFLLALSSCAPASCIGPANQTWAFAAGTGQWAARVCWKHETLRGEAVTKAFHCRQMLSVCADFSCF